MPDYIVKADVDSMLRADNDAGIRTAIGLGQTDAPTFLKVIVSPGAALTNGGVAFGSEFDLRSAATNTLMGFWRGNSFRALFGGTALHTCSLGSIGFSDTSTDVAVTDTLLWRDAAGILAQRNGTAKQALRVYNTNLSGAPEWAEFDWITSGVGNTLRIGTNLSGTGAARPIEFVTGGNVRLTIGASGTAIFSNAVRLDSFFYIGAANGVSLQSSSSATGVLLLQNGATDDFGRIQLGGTTDAFPAIARDGAGIKITGAAAGSTSWIKVPAVAVSALPPAATAGVGARSFVNDALAPTFASAVTGGGAVTVPVYSTGSAWNVG